MMCRRCKTESRNIDYIQVYYQEWICTGCLVAKALTFLGREAEQQNRRADDDGMRKVTV